MVPADFRGWLEACAAKEAWAQEVLVEVDQVLTRLAPSEYSSPEVAISYVDLIEEQGRRLYGVRYSIPFGGRQRDRRLKAHLIVDRRPFAWDKCRCGGELGFMEYFAVPAATRDRELSQRLGCSDICEKCIQLRDKDDNIGRYYCPSGLIISKGAQVSVNAAGFVVPAAPAEVIVGEVIVGSTDYYNIVTVKRSITEAEAKQLGARKA